MDRGSKERFEAAVIAVFLILMLVSVPVLYLVLDAPLVMVGALAAVYIVVAALILFYTRQRFKEIEEGLEDAVDNY